VGYRKDNGFLPGEPVDANIEEASDDGSHKEGQDIKIHYP
jgi:hypothetical protein